MGSHLRARFHKFGASIALLSILWQGMPTIGVFAPLSGFVKIEKVEAAIVVPPSLVDRIRAGLSSVMPATLVLGTDQSPMTVRALANAKLSEFGFPTISTNFADQGAVASEPTTLQAMCNLYGYQDVVSSKTKWLGDGRNNFSSCHDNVNAVWSNGTITFPSACQNNWASQIVCQTPMIPTGENPECSNTRDDDGDGGTDLLIEFNPNNSELFTIPGSGKPHNILAWVNDRLIEQGKAPLDTVATLMRQDDATEQELCRMAGYAQVSSSDCEWIGDGRCNYSSPGDNWHWSWNGSSFQKLGARHNTWLSTLVCGQRLPSCSNGIDDDHDGKTDFGSGPNNDSGCATANDDSEIQHDLDCRTPNDPESGTPQCRDGIDNVDPEDTLLDAEDPGCYSNGNIVTGIYNSDDTDETHSPTCNNGVRDQSAEQCDDGNTSSADTCSSICTLTTCGDGTRQQPNGLGIVEACDDGALNGQPGKCNLTCTGIIAAGQCVDGIDNDNDGTVDFGPGANNDPGCSSSTDPDEIGTIQCDDGLDNDNDGRIDFRVTGQDDADCTGPRDNTESPPAPAPFIVLTPSNRVPVGTVVTACGSPWQNPANPLDVNNDGVIAPNDTLPIINRINSSGIGPLPVPTGPGQEPPPYFDVDGDGNVAERDADIILSYLNTGIVPPSGVTRSWEVRLFNNGGETVVLTGNTQCITLPLTTETDSSPSTFYRFTLTLTDTFNRSVSDQEVAEAFANIPACNDTIDNDFDTRNNCADPGCHTDDNVANASTCNPNDPDETNTPRCGNGVSDQISEQCDDGNTSSTDACSTTCQRTTCGDGIRQIPNGVGQNEACDEGAQNGIPGHCNLTCSGIVSAVQCSDGIDNADPEDVLADAQDPGCYTNGNVVTGTYNPADTDETHTPACGNGARDQIAEQCDDGNLLNGDGCSTLCRAEVCGNGTVDSGEVCDEGSLNGTPNHCNSLCSGTTPALCGNGVPEGAEQCDDGNVTNGDTCSALCQFTVCGDGIRQVPNGQGVIESCDDGVLNGQPGRCNFTCTGFVPAQVDLAALKQVSSTTVQRGGRITYTINAFNLSTTTNATGIVFTDPVPSADLIFNAGLSSSSCFFQSTGGVFGSVTCSGVGTIAPGGSLPIPLIIVFDVRTSISCASSYVNSVTVASAQVDSNLSNNTHSAQTVTVACACGNGTSDPGEQCDDGNVSNADACSNTCLRTVCGDSIRQSPNGVGVFETCDEGVLNGTPNHCNSSCSGVTPAACGNGIPEGTEQCDDGNTSNSDSCTSSCLNTICGDGIRQTPNGFGVNESCDEGVQNGIPGHCNLTCTGLVPAPQCNDAIDNDFDTRNNCADPGCHTDDNAANASTCNPNDPDETNTPRCGNGVSDQTSEQCDDGNASNIDTCNTSCQLTICGDNIRQIPNGFGLNETCDEGSVNGQPGHCNTLCTGTVPVAQCSDGIDNVDPEDFLADAQDPGCYSNGNVVTGTFNPNDTDESHVPVCGNGANDQSSEQCDDGNLSSADLCNNFCQRTLCGDNIRQTPNGFGLNESCDEGIQNGQPG
ncbi:MAG TPA: DUF4215 domain-containing protein, partial [Candidatus Peribacterales bacterium]|nr:DUF4215 domain-containing protein [Candidatus Peribacterales bacterium]